MRDRDTHADNAAMKLYAEHKKCDRVAKKCIFELVIWFELIEVATREI